MVTTVIILWGPGLLGAFPGAGVTERPLVLKGALG